MVPRHIARFSFVVGAALVLAGCGGRAPTQYWPAITDPVVFGDTFGSNVIWQAFANSKLDAISIDATTSYTGTASLKVVVPDAGANPGWSGGAMTTARQRDLSGYNALTFWVKASRACNLDVAGFANDNTGTSKYTAQRAAIPMTTSWTMVTIPIPNAARLTAEGGMFFFSEGPQSGTGLTFWVDDVKFVKTATITNPRPALTSQTINTIVGSTVDLSGTTKTVYTVLGIDQTVTHMPGYFDFTSSNPSYGSVVDGKFRVQAAGLDTLTAKLGTVAATGRIVLNAQQPPTTLAPTPTVPANNVISLFSSAYSNVPVDTWSATWDLADVSDFSISGHPVKLYTNLTYAGIEFTTHELDVSQMTACHIDVYAPSGTTFKVKLVDFGPNGVYDAAGDDKASELTFNATSTPAFTAGGWVSLEIPMANFTALTTRAHLAQIVLSGDTKTVYVDNLYFHK